MKAKGGFKIRQFDDAPISGVNIVPVIDLCLVLLVILLIISPLLDKPPVEAKLPPARTEEVKENAIAITVSPSGKMAVNSDIIKKEDLPQVLESLIKEQGEEVDVVINADKSLTYKDLTDLLKTAKEAGAKKISVGTEEIKGK